MPYNPNNPNDPNFPNSNQDDAWQQDHPHAGQSSPPAGPPLQDPSGGGGGQGAAPGQPGYYYGGGDLFGDELGPEAANPYSPKFQWGAWDPNTVKRDANGHVVFTGATGDINRYRSLAEAARNGSAPQADFTLANQYLAQGNQGLGMMREAAMGQTPSAAQYQMQQGLGQAFANQQALAGGARGAGAMGVAQASAAQGMAGLQGQTVANAGALRAQEMANARGQYFQGASSLANLQGGWALDQARLREQQNALNLQGGLGYEHLGYGVGQSQLQANIEQQGQAEGHWKGQAGMDEAQVDRETNAAMSGVGAVGDTFKSTSDIRAKKEIRSDEDKRILADVETGYPKNMRENEIMLSLARHAQEQQANPGLALSRRVPGLDESLAAHPAPLGQTRVVNYDARGNAYPTNAPGLASAMIYRNTAPMPDMAHQQIAPQRFLPYSSAKVAEGAALSQSMAAPTSMPGGAAHPTFPMARPEPFPVSPNDAMDVSPPPTAYMSDEHLKYARQPQDIANRITSDKHAKHEARLAGKAEGFSQGLHAAFSAPSPTGAAQQRQYVPNMDLGDMGAQGYMPAQDLGDVDSPGFMPPARDFGEADSSRFADPNEPTDYSGGIYRTYSDEQGKDSIDSTNQRYSGESKSYNRLPLSEALKKTDADKFLDTLQPFTYRYKDPANEPNSNPNGGRYLGVMAQNVERGPTGNTIVTETSRGKALEGGAMMSAMAAGLGRLHQRMSELEEAKKQYGKGKK